ncbi:uncharacterized protein IUM83_08794 [Phytophthora cinnamomi]|uniref:uncharacterized protein n=1 Tax=Phytophthora cinnamomi TaxID=4785 RepID=UPI00355A90BC|nr:hypothetical protein IUM83_08794 [Phytophthora cinnamomi]
MVLSMAPYAVTLACILLRGFQLVFALVSMITASMTFPMTSASNGLAFRLGSAENLFVLVVAYTVAQYSGALLILVELFPMMLRPRATLTRTADGLLAVLALSAGIVLATSDYGQDCDGYAVLVRCTNLRSSYIFVILSAVPLIGSVLLTFVESDDLRVAEMEECRDRAGSYRMVAATPGSSTLSPIDNRYIVTA